MQFLELRCAARHLAESLFQREDIRIGFYLTGFVLAERAVVQRTHFQSRQRRWGETLADLQGFFATVNLPKTQDFSSILSVSPHGSWVQIPGAEVQ